LNSELGGEPYGDHEATVDFLTVNRFTHWVNESNCGAVAKKTIIMLFPNGLHLSIIPNSSLNCGI